MIANIIGIQIAIFIAMVMALIATPFSLDATTAFGLFILFIDEAIIIILGIAGIIGVSKIAPNKKV